jgi:DNA-binding SARP family transcriptional activator
VDGYMKMRRLVAKDADFAVETRIGGDFNLASMRIQLTGRITVESAAGTVVGDRLLYGRQAPLIFAMLVVERDRPISRDELAEELWPHMRPRSWEPALRGVVSKVRTFLTVAGLPDNAVASRGFGGYQLHLPPDVVVDVESARSAVENADQVLREGNPTQAIALAEYARKVVVRTFFPNEKGWWVDRVRDGLGKVLLWALCVLGEGYAQRGQYQFAMRAVEDAIALEPFRERTHQLLIQVHAAAGNPAEALRAYDRCRRLLADELGVVPTAETAALHLALLSGT